jgi:hypothetical protein
MRPVPTLLAGLLACCAAGSAAALEGRYTIEGVTPGDDARPYEGEVEVRRTGETYAIAWRTTGGNYVGTGLLSGATLSIIYTSTQIRGVPGLATYEVVNNKVTKGTWTNLGARVSGTEIWKAVEKP